MSFISSGAIHHRNWNLLLDLNGDGGQIPSGGGGGSHTLTYSWDNPQAAIEITQLGVVPKFNPGSGTLTGISLTLTNNLTGAVELDCLGAGFPKNIKWTTICDLFTTCGIPAVDLLINDIANIFIETTANTGTFLASNGVNYPFPSLPATLSATYDLTPMLASFIGAVGNVTFTGQTLTSGAVTNGAGVTAIVSTVAGFAGSLTYTYTTP